MRKFTSLNSDIIGSLRLPNRSLIEGDLMGFCSTSLSISFSYRAQNLRQFSFSIEWIQITLLIKGTSGSLRLPNLSRNEGERTALRSIWWSSDKGSKVSLCSKYSYKSLIESVYARESEIDKFKRYFRWKARNVSNSLSPFAGAAHVSYDETINTKLSAIRFNWFIFEFDGMLKWKDEKKGNKVIVVLCSNNFQSKKEEKKISEFIRKL